MKRKRDVLKKSKGYFPLSWYRNIQGVWECLLHPYNLISPASLPTAMRYASSRRTKLRANATLVIDSFGRSRCSETALNWPKTGCISSDSPQTTTFPSLEPVAKYEESWLHEQHQIILEWTPVDLSVLAISLNFSPSES